MVKICYVGCQGLLGKTLQRFHLKK